jgi:NAD(P)-dependent dehydrogenase (short-subunit alcohol dehydrogenase family)
MTLKNKTALITGGSRGIGKAVALAFLREGARVMLAARSEEELLAVKQELKKDFGGIETCRADVSSPSDVAALIKAMTKTFGGEFDVLVNAAGIFGPIGPFEGLDFDAWKKTFDINVFGTFNTIQAVAPFMKKAGYGKIINFGGAGDGALPRFSAYSASKGAVARLTETIAAELKDSHIDVNAIAPGPVNTKFLDDALAAGEKAVGAEQYKKLLSQKEAGGTPPELAGELCVFLASSASDGLTGKMISAKWDNWKQWDKKKIEEIMKSDIYTLRRVAK